MITNTILRVPYNYSQLFYNGPQNPILMIKAPIVGTPNPKPRGKGCSVEADLTHAQQKCVPSHSFLQHRL